MKAPFGRGIWLGLALIAIPSLALLALETYVAISSAPQLARNSEQVVRTFDVITTAQALQRSVQDAERGQRGYLLTGEEQYLAPYRKALGDIPGLLTRFRELTADNPEHAQRARQAEEQIRVKLAELAASIDVFQKNGLDAAKAMLHSNVGLDAMESITGLLDGAVAAQSFALNDQLARSASDVRRVAALTEVAGGLAVAVMTVGLLVGWLSLRNMLASERARAQSEERFHRFVEGLTDYAVYMLDIDGNVASWNAGAQRIKGYSAPEILGRHFSLFYTDEDRARGEPERALAAARAGKYEAESWRVRKSGERFFANVVINPVRDASGNLIGYAKVTRDISERKRQEQALEQARAELAQAQKMEALGQLSGGVAHDFNNVLHVINNAVALLSHGLKESSPEMLRCLDMIKRNAERASSLTQRLLAFSRAQPLDPMTTDPNALVTGMAELLRQTLGERVVIETVLGDGVWPVHVDINQLETAIVNLAVNARDAMPDGGVLTIRTDNAVLDVRLAPDVEPGDYAVIAVRDNGVGMTPETKAKAFEPFFTTKGPGQGTGLGLSQVFGFIKQSRGHVVIDSAPGQGTTIRLYLPRFVEPPRKPEEQPREQDAAAELRIES